MIKKSLILISAFIMLQACSTVDDYILGKDNTPKPQKLEPIKTKVNLAETWSVSAGKSSASATYLKLKPVVHRGIIYSADASGVVQAIENKTAKVLWSQQLKNKIISGPTINNNVIAVGTDQATVALLDKKGGNLLWTTKLSDDALSKPVITNDKIIVKTISGHLYGLNLKNGEKEWVADHGSPNLILKASSAPVIYEKTILAGFSDGKLDAIDLQTGAVLWQRGIAYSSGSSDVERLVDIDSDPIIQGSTAYLATYQGYVGAFSLTNGQFLWRKPASTYKNIAVDNDSLYLADSEDVIWAYDLTNGQVRWKQPGLQARSVTEPVLMNNQIILGDKAGFLHVLSKQNGEFLSRKQLSSSIYSAPTVSGNKIYVMTGNGKLNKLAVS